MVGQIMNLGDALVVPVFWQIRRGRLGLWAKGELAIARSRESFGRSYGLWEES
jgi:hypothetical protein